MSVQFSSGAEAGRRGRIVSIQKSLSEDAVRTPSKMDGSVFPVRRRGIARRSRGVRASLEPTAGIRWLTMTALGLAQE